MPHGPLTPESLREYVSEQTAIENGIAEDCEAIEEILVRLAGPPLTGIDEDAALLQELNYRLADPIVKGVKKDTNQLSKLVGKLYTPIDRGIAEDTTVLTGIAARAYGSRFHPDARGALAGRVNPHTGKVVSGTTHPSSGFGDSLGVAEALGHSGPSPVGSTSAAPRPTAARQTRPAAVPAMTPGGLRGGSLSEMLPVWGEEFPPVAGSTAVPGALGGHAPGLLDVSPEDLTHHAPEQKPDLNVVSGASGGRTVAIGSDYTAPGRPTLPAPPPPLPEPPPAGCDLCQAVLHLAEVMGGQLSAIAQALYTMRPDVVRAEAEARAQDDLDSSPPLEWTDPPNQAVTDKDAEGVYSHPEEILDEAQLLVTSGASAGRTVSLPLTR